MQGIEAAAFTDERSQSELMVESLARTAPRGETLAELAHDARNMVTALALYCELLDEPGVLSSPFHHYGTELRMVAESSRRLLDRMLLLDSRQAKARPPAKPRTSHLEGRILEGANAGNAMSELSASDTSEAIADLREEVLANRNVLSALAGPNVAVSVNACGGAVPVRMSGEELTRILVNLVRNAAESISGSGSIRIGLSEQQDGPDHAASVTLTVEDSGSGVSEAILDKIFESGFSMRGGRTENRWAARHRGLGLSITRSIVEAAGGNIRVENRREGGARFAIELPLRGR